MSGYISFPDRELFQTGTINKRQRAIANYPTGKITNLI